MVFAAGDFCVSVSTLLVSLFCFIFKSLFGYSKPEFVEFKDCQDDEKENPKSFLKFQFPGYEEFNQSNGGNDDCVSFKVIGLYGSFRNAEIIDSEGDLMRRNSETEGSDEDEEPPDDSELNALAAIGEKIELYMGDSNPEELSLHADSNNSSFRNTEIIDVGRELYTQTLSINGEKAESAEGDTNTEELVKLQMSTDNRSGPEDDFLRNSSVQSSSSWDSHESNGLETLWEHQDLIEQLKMELKKVKATGLPTILEETQSPMEDQ